MVDMPFVDALNHEAPWEAKTSNYFHGILVDSISHEVLCQRTVVAVCDFFVLIGRLIFRRHTPTVIKVLHIDEVYVTISVSIVGVCA